ncbi:MAG: hypothetical protein C4560_08410 [Nitrospiraceae bacterium]|nr:MAG: hypothetical protein C4560_08410 [Nitrospiraceae bacterium]
MRKSRGTTILFIFALLCLIACAPEQTIRHEVPAVPQDTFPAVDEKKPAGIDNIQLKFDGPNGGFSPSHSPDGSMIAFLSSTLHTPPDLWIVKADGTDPRRLTTRGVKSLRWSPDGKSIMVITNRKGFDETLFVGIDDEAGEKRIPGLIPGASIPIYSPDRNLFAFTAPGEKNVRDLWIGTADGERTEPVTEKMGVRDVFWNPDSTKIYYEVGASYSVGIWEMDLATMESRPLLSNYIGRPDYSEKAGLIAYAYPVNPGEFEVHTMKLDGSDVKNYKAPRLSGRWLLWDVSGKGIYYTGQDITEKDDEKKEDIEKPEKQDSPHEGSKKENLSRTGVNSLWHLDLETGIEERISPPELHVSGFSLSPDGSKILFSGVLRDSFTSELFTLDPATGEMFRLVKSRASSWLPLPSRDSSKTAFFTNEGAGGDSIKVVSAEGEELASYPVILEGDTRISWLPESEGLLIFSSRGLLAFTEKGPIEFPTGGDHRAFLYADVSMQEDKVLLNSIPRFGETPGLYILEAKEGKFVQTDLRYPAVKEIVPELYFQPKWSFDGGDIAFTDRIEVWTMKSDGTGRKWITNYAEGNRQENGKQSLASHPAWSVNGQNICYTLMVYESETILRQIWVVKADGSEARVLFSEKFDSQFQVYLPEYTNQPFFDATDEHIVFTAVNNGIPDIFSVGINDGKVQRLTENGAIFPALLPEEGIIIYTSLEGNSETLWFMNSDGTDKRQLLIKGKNENKPGGEGAK